MLLFIILDISFYKISRLNFSVISTKVESLYFCVHWNSDCSNTFGRLEYLFIIELIRHHDGTEFEK